MTSVIWKMWSPHNQCDSFPRLPTQRMGEFNCSCKKYFIVIQISFFSSGRVATGLHIDGLVQVRCNSSALAMELRHSCTNPSTCFSVSMRDKFTHWGRDKMCALCRWYIQMHFYEKKIPCILILISLKLVLKCLIDNMSALVQLLTWHRVIIWPNDDLVDWRYASVGLSELITWVCLG